MSSSSIRRDGGGPSMESAGSSSPPPQPPPPFLEDLDSMMRRSRDVARRRREERLSKRRRRRRRRWGRSSADDDSGRYSSSSRSSRDLLMSSSSSSSEEEEEGGEESHYNARTTTTTIATTATTELDDARGSLGPRDATSNDPSSPSDDDRHDGVIGHSKDELSRRTTITGSNNARLLGRTIWENDDDDDTSSDDAVSRLAARRRRRRMLDAKAENGEVKDDTSVISHGERNGTNASSNTTAIADRTTHTAGSTRDAAMSTSIVEDGRKSAVKAVDLSDDTKGPPPEEMTWDEERGRRSKGRPVVSTRDGDEDEYVPLAAAAPADDDDDDHLPTVASTTSDPVLDSDRPIAFNRDDDGAAHSSTSDHSNQPSIACDEDQTSSTFVANISDRLARFGRSTTTTSGGDDAGPITGREARTRPDVEWTTHVGCLLVRTVVGRRPPGDMIAGFDLDHTLVNWICAGWPNRPEHYELWNSNVVYECRRLHDSGYGLVIYTNQGGIKSALNGKRATTVRGVIDWIAQIVDRPVYAVVSTKADSGHHKGSPKMWEVFENRCNGGRQARPDLSFFVGDADGAGDKDDGVATDTAKQRHQLTGTDKLFAKNVGEMRNTTMEFFTPGEYFGPSNAERRRRGTVSTATEPAVPREAMRARAALWGGYSTGPICLVLVGVQGSGKSTFCQKLVEFGSRWRQFSQDTIRNGSPGSRQAVEEAAREALRNGNSVVIDRMHLDEEQRRHFVLLGKQCQVPVHCLVFVATREEVQDRVRCRVDHPGKVQGEDGARIAVTSLPRLRHPSYDEGFALINYSCQLEGRLWTAYQRLGSSGEDPVPRTICLHNAGKMLLPMITFGTMNIKKRDSIAIVTQALHMGVTSVDTAPTYGNESEVGAAIMEQFSHVKVTIKVPKRATSPEEARKEVVQSLSLLRRSQVDIILLHWPCDFIESDTLSTVWKELEKMKEEGLCLAIGVCNFTTKALMTLLEHCTIKPSLNQVERHPLLPQYDLLEYCDSHGIIVQSHTALGNGHALLLGNDTISRVARECLMSPAQVLLCWNLQQNTPVVIKFSSREHGEELIASQQENTTLRLSPLQMKAIDDISFSNCSHRFVAPPFMYREGAAYSWGE